MSTNNLSQVKNMSRHKKERKKEMILMSTKHQIRQMKLKSTSSSNGNARVPKASPEKERQ